MKCLLVSCEGKRACVFVKFHQAQAPLPEWAPSEQTAPGGATWRHATPAVHKGETRARSILPASVGRAFATLSLGILLSRERVSLSQGEDLALGNEEN